MNKIEFKQTSNIFINTGIVALYRYLKKYESRFPEKYAIVQNELQKNKLIVECDNLLPLLEDVYYFMGEELYDTATKKQLEEKDKYYFVKEPFDAVPFSKIKTLGFSSIVTGNPPVTKGKGGKKLKFDKLYEQDYVFAFKIAEFLNKKNKKLKFYSFIDGKLEENEIISGKKRKENTGGYSEIFINAGYTTIPQLEFNEEYFAKGNQICPLTNIGYKKLVENKSSSAFLSGLSNFNSYLYSSDKKISWKAMYLMRFSPALVFYHYKKGYDTLICDFFNSNNLHNINSLNNPELLKPRIELEQQKPLPYNSNFNFFDFSYTKKDNEEYKVNLSDDAIYSSELSFLLLYTFYQRNFKIEISKEKIEDTNISDPFTNYPLEKVPISLIVFKADKFTSTTKRPNEYEEFNNIKFVFRLIYKLEHNEIEKNKVLIKNVWRYLKIKTPSSENAKRRRQFDKAKYEERKIRAKVFEHLLKSKSVISQIEKLFYDSYKYKMENFDVGYRNYKTLLNFLIIYEQSLKINVMDKELQQKAINLGKSIGQGILRFNNEDKKTNAKAGRKYLIGIHKSRTLLQFMDNLYRVANKYSVSISKEILENIDEDNFQLIRQFVLISALNQINSVL